MDEEDIYGGLLDDEEGVGTLDLLNMGIDTFTPESVDEVTPDSSPVPAAGVGAPSAGIASPASSAPSGGLSGSAGVPVGEPVSSPVSGAETISGGLELEDDDLEDESEMASIVKPIKDESIDSEIQFEDESIESEDLVTLEERAREHADKLMSVLVREGEGYREHRRWLYANATPHMFYDENFLLYNLIYKYRNDGFSLDKEFIDTYYDVHVAEIDKARDRIDINAYGSVDGSAARGYAAGLQKHFDVLNGIKEVSDEEFYRSYENYLLYYQQIEGRRAYSEAMSILEDGIKSKSKRGMVSGFEDSQDYIKRKFAEIDGTINRNSGSGFVSLRDSILNPVEGTEIFKVTDFGDIRELNNHYGGIYSGQLITVVAPPKSGKSKLTSRWMHNAAVRDGRNVTVWPVEGGIKMWEAQIRAIHFDYLYNSNVIDRRDMKLGVSQKTIVQNSWETDGLGELMALESASKLDLVTNAEYGSIDMIDRPFMLETFIEEIDASASSNNSSAICIDYMQLISNRSGLTKQQALSKAYPELLEYAKKTNRTIISPAQYSQEALKDIGKKGTDGQEMRASVGESAEIIRSSDIVIALYASTEDLRNNKLTFMSIPSRFAEPFEQFAVYADMATCNFVSFDE